MIRHLRRQFMLIAMLSYIFVMLLIAVAINLMNFYRTNLDLENKLQSIYQNEGAAPRPLDVKPGEKPQGPLTKESPFSTRFFVLYYKADGTLDSTQLTHIAAVTRDNLSPYLEAAIEQGEGYAFSGDYKFLVKQINDGRKMAIFLDWQMEKHALQTFAINSVLVITVSFGLVFLLVLFFSKRVIDPVVQSVEKQKQFITNASHELKTPLTVITTCLKVLELEPGEQKWINKAQAQSEKLSDLVNELVSLSRLDEERVMLSIQSFDLSQAALETVDSFRDFALAKGHPLKAAVVEGLQYEGDERLLRQLMSIFLDNAVKHADLSSEIFFSLSCHKKEIVLACSNRCSSLAKEDLVHLFERFYRGDKSRSQQGGQHSFGIGLAMAKNIAEAHKAKISAQFMEEGRLQFTVCFR